MGRGTVAAGDGGGAATSRHLPLRQRFALPPPHGFATGRNQTATSGRNPPFALERDDIWLIQRGFFFGRFSDSYVDAPYGKGFVVAMALIGCFHMSGLFVRRFECRWP